MMTRCTGLDPWIYRHMCHQHTRSLCSRRTHKHQLPTDDRPPLATTSAVPTRPPGLWRFSHSPQPLKLVASLVEVLETRVQVRHTPAPVPLLNPDTWYVRSRVRHLKTCTSCTSMRRTTWPQC